MHIRTFKAPTLQDALAEIRRQMGSDATILHTREVSRGMFGLLGTSHVEVTAGLRPKSVGEQNAPPASAKQQFAPRESIDVARLSQEVNRLVAVVESLEQRSFEVSNQAMTQSSSDLLTSVVGELNTHWVQQTIGATESENVDDLNLIVRRELRKRIRTAGPIVVPFDQQRVVSLVGPTGVGKTTTVAKLAAGFRLQEKRKVGLITIDTFRIAAVDQLHKYAQVMDLPMEVVSNVEEMTIAMNRLKDVDLILIDTVGRSPRDTQQIEVTRKLLERAEPDETHLVISATSSQRVIESVVDTFALLKPNAVILSKLDEVESQQEILWFARDEAMAVSYVTTGQKVPDDIDIAQPSDLINLALAKRTNECELACGDESASMPEPTQDPCPPNLLAPDFLKIEQ